MYELRFTFYVTYIFCLESIRILSKIGGKSGRKSRVFVVVGLGDNVQPPGAEVGLRNRTKVTG